MDITLSRPPIAAGLPIPGNGGPDFWGNKVPEGKCPFIGRYEKP